MPLTPQDVRDVVFKSSRTKRGYLEEEVDSFLDRVESELTRLLDENGSLRSQLAAARSAAPTLSPATGSFPVVGTEQPALAAQGPAGLAVPTGQTPLATGVSAPLPPPASTPASGELEEMLRRTLLLAQRTADAAVAEAHEEARRLVAQAQDDAARVSGDAQGHAVATVAQAREQATALIESAERDRSRLLRELEGDRTRLAAQVDALRSFEAEHRTRLRAYLEMQLSELETDTSGEEQAALAAGPPQLGLGSAAGAADGSTATSYEPTPLPERHDIDSSTGWWAVTPAAPVSTPVTATSDQPHDAHPSTEPAD